MLDRASVLVVEDEPFVALDIALAVEDAGGIVVGPAASVREALELIETQHIVAAILDVNLIDGDITLVVETLMALAIPLILQTGGGLPVALEAQFPHLVVVIKPTVAARLVEQLSGMFAVP